MCACVVCQLVRVYASKCACACVFVCVHVCVRTRLCMFFFWTYCLEIRPGSRIRSARDCSDSLFLSFVSILISGLTQADQTDRPDSHTDKTDGEIIQTGRTDMQTRQADQAHGFLTGRRQDRQTDRPDRQATQKCRQHKRARQTRHAVLTAV